jgi:hypothetical protein
VFQSVLISLTLCKSQFQASVIFPPRFAGADLALPFAPFALEAWRTQNKITFCSKKNEKQMAGEKIKLQKL